MRIIKPGKAPQHRLMRGTCTICGCEVECQRCEAMASPDQREQGWYVDCPTTGCGGMIWLKESPER